MKQMLKVITAATMFIVLLIMKRMHEDFGVLRTGKKEPEAIHIMETFPDSPLVLLIYKFTIQFSALVCAAFNAGQMIYGEIVPGIAVISALVTAVTAGLYVSYRKTIRFFNGLEERIVSRLTELKERSDANGEKNDA